MSARRSIYLTDAAEAAIGPGAESLSGRINSMLIRYDAIRVEECPALTEAEWCALCDVLNGTYVAAEHTDTDPARFLWAELADAPEMAEKWHIDHPALVARLRTFSLAERIAVLEVAARFWRSPRLNEASNAELLAEAGARVMA
jgi:hypothetical protein